MSVEVSSIFNVWLGENPSVDKEKTLSNESDFRTKVLAESFEWSEAKPAESINKSDTVGKFTVISDSGFCASKFTITGGEEKREIRSESSFHDAGAGMLAVGKASGMIEIYSLATGQLIKKIVGHEEGVTTVKITAMHLISGGNAGEISVFDLSSFELLKRIKLPTDQEVCSLELKESSLIVDLLKSRMVSS